MAISLTNGLSDTSRELGETVTKQTTRRIESYNDAIQDFANDSKWPFLVKKDESLTTISGQNNYSLAGITDIRKPGGIKLITIGTTDYSPIDYTDRNDDRYDGGKYFYLDPDDGQFTFMTDITTTGTTITIWYYYIPARITSVTAVETFPIPDRYRKVIAVLAGAYVQWSRYLEAQGNRLYNLYTKLVRNVGLQQSERNSNHPRKLQHFLQHKGFQRTYPH
ncbi:MAG: hypothetical protein A2184_01070 [Candidatus Moranbacteria bacterium RIFOXYA1_FULL_44_7]|nr:MAG: hypothetical protein A2184_01070 [Candidatus Moranbacteria bacterium RIFOXYA1_FULL_44_7]OGZ28566.1 MAG: hypothetical protein A2562_04230 [Candidatus Nealsonbacteria bacterium RIFOXYD1_FULL_39_11]